MICSECDKETFENDIRTVRLHRAIGRGFLWLCPECFQAYQDTAKKYAKYSIANLTKKLDKASEVR